MRLTGNRCLCSGCGEYFNSVSAFDLHRRGKYAQMGQPETRYCLSADQMATIFIKNVAGFWAKPERPDSGRRRARNSGDQTAPAT